MIAREWRARAAAPGPYHEVFTGQVASELTAVPGFRGAYLLARPDGPETVLRTLTLFDALDDVRAFAGPAYEREHVTSAARAVILGSDPVIRHYDVLAQVPGR